MLPRRRACKANGRAFAHIAQFHPELTALRRDLHAHPELGFEEIYTSGRVQRGAQAVRRGRGPHRHRQDRRGGRDQGPRRTAAGA